MYPNQRLREYYGVVQNSRFPLYRSLIAKLESVFTTYIQYRSQLSYYLSRDVNRVARYAIPVAQDAILVARDGLKNVSIVAKIIERFNQSVVKLVCSWPSPLYRIYFKGLS